MNLKRAILTGVLLWVLIFFEISVLMFGFNLETPEINYVHYVLSIFIVGFVTSYYLRGRGVKKGWQEGLLFGVVLVVVGIILDAIITVPLFIRSYSFFLNISTKAPQCLMTSRGNFFLFSGAQHWQDFFANFIQI